MEFLKGLKKNGQQPGWSRDDKGMGYLEAYSYFGPKSVTLNARKNGDSSSYHYTMTQAAKDSPWKLQKAWRTDKKGHTIKEY